MALVALVIVGPERLPALARDAAKLFKKFRQFIQNAKREVEKELELDQLNSLNESINHVEGLMQEAPDRFMQEEANKPEIDSSK